MTSPTERSIPELFGDAMAQLAKLVGNEFALARAEMSEKAEQVGRSSGSHKERAFGSRRLSLRRGRSRYPCRHLDRCRPQPLVG